MKGSQHVSGQLFGYRELPAESGLWGVLLPRPGEKPVAHEPVAQDVIESINADRLVFTRADRVGNRGFGLSFGVYVGLMICATLLPLFLWGMTSAKVALSPWELFFFFSLLLCAGGIPLTWAYLSAKRALPPPIVISRSRRKVWTWLDHQKQWTALDYDRVTPATFVRRVVTGSGSATVYALALCQLKPGTREIEFSVVPAPAQGTPQACGELWEFIRRYMDGDPAALPAVRLVPPLDHPKAWMARSDRTVFAGQIDEQHRIKRDGFSMAVVWFWGSLGYWWERAAGWIERTAPRRPLPLELQETAPGKSNSAYRVIPFTAIEQQAQAGTLPHMRRRWFICGVIGTAVWGWLFGLLVVGIWVMR